MRKAQSAIELFLYVVVIIAICVTVVATLGKNFNGTIQAVKDRVDNVNSMN